MRKLLRPRDILLLSLAGIGDIFEEFTDPLMIMGKAYKNMYGFIPHRYKRNNFLKTVDRSLKTGYIEKIEKNGEIFIRLTTNGDKKIKRDFSLWSLSKNKWDGKWRVLFFDIEEASRTIRERLRVKLKELGFGMIQKSAWITPHDISVDFYEFITACELNDNVFLIEGKDLLAGDKKDLAQRVWKLNELEEEYIKLEIEVDKVKQLTAIDNDRHKKREAKMPKIKEKEKMAGKLDKKKRKLKNDYMRILFTDPCLPKELLPEGWVGDRVRKKIKQL